jgi:hypothetical protein
MLWIVENVALSLVSATIHKRSYPPPYTSHTDVVLRIIGGVVVIHNPMTPIHNLDSGSPLNYTDVVSRDTSH